MTPHATKAMASQKTTGRMGAGWMGATMSPLVVVTKEQLQVAGSMKAERVGSFEGRRRTSWDVVRGQDQLSRMLGGFRHGRLERQMPWVYPLPESAAFAILHEQSL